MEGWTGSISLIGFDKFAFWRKGIGAEQVHGNIVQGPRRTKQRTIRDVLHHVARKGSEFGADVPQAAYVGLPLLREFERRRDMADEYAGCH